jgi:NAD-dependent SIR2 family protein deacetylase
MGVDSGLPDFRGNEGFWKAYPPYAKLGMSFVQLANPAWFRSDPTLAWGFYGHRYNLYRATRPHEGFAILHRWAGRMPYGAFIYTSNVDGAFQVAGFDPDRILEVHGSVHWMQCSRRCGKAIFPAETAAPNGLVVDDDSMRAREPLPACPDCCSLARPNILMFGDGDWDETRAYVQEVRLRQWVQSLTGARVVVVECGAGTAIPTVRRFCEAMAEQFDGTLVRLNIREPEVPHRQVGLAMGALTGLRAIDALLPAAGEAAPV